MYLPHSALRDVIAHPLPKSRRSSRVGHPSWAAHQTLGALLLCLLLTPLRPLAWAQGEPEAPQSQILFTMGQLEVFAREADTTFTVTDLSTGQDYITITLAEEGDRFSRTAGVPQFISVNADRPVSLFTGKALADRNDWSSVMNSDNNTEFGTTFHGFTEHYLWVFVPRVAGQLEDTEITVNNLSSGTLTTLTSADAETFLNSEIEVYELSGFSNDTLIVECNHACVTQVGSSSIKNTTGWSFSPPSMTPGEDGRELGTHFAFFANPDLTIWPFSDDTEVEIIDLSDGDDSRTIQLDAHQFFSLRDLSVLTTGDRELVHASNNLFDQDFVEIKSDRPILVSVGPNYDPGGGFTLDFAPTVPTGQDQHESFVYGNGIGVELLTYDRDTTMTLSTISGDAHHDHQITPDDWQGVGPYYYTAPFSWSRELIHVVSNRPTVIFYGDFLASYFSGCCSASFVPVIPPTRELPPVAEAGVSVLACPYDTIAYDASDSFDQDGLGEPPAIRATRWDFDIFTDSDGVGGADDDIDSIEVSGQYTYSRSGVYQMKLTVEDNEGDIDVDFLYIDIDVSQIELCGHDDDEDDVGSNNDNCAEVSNADQRDQDGDEVGDACDDDLDGDGEPNVSDNCADLSNPAQEDADQDGLGDACDTDDDNDGVEDDLDLCPLAPDYDQLDTDGDGIGDACDDDYEDDYDGDGVADVLDNCPLVANPDQRDADSDGLGDLCDVDADSDGIMDAVDNCPLVRNIEQIDTDQDGDGDLCDDNDDDDEYLDVDDLCPTVATENQTDTDQDGIGDMCEEDDDNDGIDDAEDNCPLSVNVEQHDFDQDGRGDRCDDDDDDDGILDVEDVCIHASDPDQLDTDGDGAGDACDDDDDNDQLPDDVDTCPLVSDREALDTDGDGRGDVCDDDDDGDQLSDERELELGTDPLRADTDSDGVSDGEEVELGTDPLDGGVVTQPAYGCDVDAHSSSSALWWIGLICCGLWRRRADLSIT